ncbi:MAG: hypothetical protein FJY85_13455 [Deltaproteobacteria bacterium]|nr:hypothetical protein [Deltaproteobacteria bacterium]
MVIDTPKPKQGETYAEVCLPKNIGVQGTIRSYDVPLSWVGEYLRWRLNTADGPGTDTYPGEAGTIQYPMPQTNAGFGQKRLYAMAMLGESFLLGMQRTARVDIKLFFDPERSDNPEGEYPNWFYYWSKGTVPSLDKFKYAPNVLYGDSYMYGEDDTWVHKIGYLAYLSIPRYYLGEVTQDGVTRKMFMDQGTAVSTPARNSFTGIHACAKCVQHELLHAVLYEERLPVDIAGEMVNRDVDDDGLPDPREQESTDGFVVGKKDSFDFLAWCQQEGGDTFRQTYAAYPDEEAYCRLQETAQKDAWLGNEASDWASPGKQTQAKDWQKPGRGNDQ